MTTGLLLLNVVSLSTSIGTLAVLAILFARFRGAGLAFLIAFVVLISADYLMGLVLLASPDSVAWLGMGGLSRIGGTDSLLIGLKGLCQVGILLTAPPAALLLIGSQPARWAVVAGFAIAMVGAAAAACQIGGFFPSARPVLAIVAGVPGTIAYGYCFFGVLHRRDSVQGRLARSIFRAFLVYAGVLTPALLADDIIAFVAARPRPMLTDPVAFLVLTGGILVCSILVLTAGGRPKPAPADIDTFCSRYGLSVREREVVQLLSEGLRYKQIADRLYISTETVKSHASRIYRKTSATGRTDILYRIRLGTP